MKINTFNKLDNKISDFTILKKESEKFWENIDLYSNVYGFQIQEGSKWKNGLTEKELTDFQSEMGFQFPESLKNFYRTMNGLDKPGIDFQGGENIEPRFGTIFYSYPNDIDKIKNQIEWIKESNNVAKVNNVEANISNIIPYYGHRFLIIDKKEQVLSMHGDDIIFWSDKLIKGIARDIFEFDYRKIKITDIDMNGFWNEKVQ